MDIRRFEIEGPVLITPRFFEDERGWFAETYKKEFFLQEAGISADFVQQNLSYSKKGVLRGLHFQKPPHAQDKLVRVECGEVLDVAVDIRVGSPTYGKHIAVRLSSDKPDLFFIPKGFAHGFLALTDDVRLAYFISDTWHKESEGGIIWNDPDLGIDWGISNPIMAEKDLAFSRLSDLDPIFSYEK